MWRKDAPTRAAKARSDAATRKAPPSNLPARRTRLIGRDRDVAAVRAMVLDGEQRLVTLTGMPGAGKTTLAFEVARDLASAMPDGAWQVSLDRVNPQTDLARQCCAALDLADEKGRTPAEQLEAHLQPRHALLVLDNCEHVRRQCARLVDRLLSVCPELRVLATSRVPLGLVDEGTYRVEPLPVPPAGAILPPDRLAAIPSVALFVERAQAMRRTFELTVENAGAVADITTGLGGLPLAVELAAARVSAMTPQDIADNMLSNRLLDRELATGPGRHATLRAALDWSYDLLPPGEQGLFRRLAALPPGWTVEAAEQICEILGQDADEVLAGIESLVHNSLIVAEDRRGKSRYGTLVPIREYARERLGAEGEEEETFRAYSRYYQRLAESLAGADRSASSFAPPVLAAFIDEQENFLAASSWAAAHGEARTALRLCIAVERFWRMRGYLHTAQVHLEAALRAEGEASEALRAVARTNLANCAQLRGDNAEATALASESLAFFQSEGSAEGEGYALAILADVALAEGAHEQARRGYRAAIDASNVRGLSTVTAWGLGSLAIVAQQEGDDGAAERLLEQARAQLANVDAPWVKGRTLAQLAPLLRRRGQLDEAGRVLREAVALLGGLEARLELADCFDELGRLAVALSHPARATVLLGAASAARESSGRALSDEELRTLQDDASRCRERLGDRRFGEAWNQGRGMDLGEAVAFALSEDEPPRSDEAHSLLAELTPREREVAHLVAEGLTNAQIAQRLVVSAGTARTHVERILRKLGCHSRVQIATIVASESPSRPEDT